LTIDRPKFDWSNAADNIGVVSYTLRLTGPEGVKRFTSTVSSFSPTIPLSDGPYTWTVIAHDLAGNASTPADPASFEINAKKLVYLPLLLNSGP
jgi:hypothetical protein